MQYAFAAVLSLSLTAACASAGKEPFDASADVRLGREVAKACFSDVGRTGGYQRVGGYDALVAGSARQQYLLVLSGGCGDLGPSGAFPVFQNYGDNCRRRGELVRTAQAGPGVSGGCTIKHIYEWNPAATPDDGETDDGETGDARN